MSVLSKLGNDNVSPSDLLVSQVEHIEHVVGALVTLDTVEVDSKISDLLNLLLNIPSLWVTVRIVITCIKIWLELSAVARSIAYDDSNLGGFRVPLL